MMNTPGGFVGPVNLGNPNEFTILELAERVIRLTGSRSRIVFNPLPADDPTQRRPDIALAQRELGWQPTIELEEGLRRTIAYFKEFAAEPPV
jgi:UDP-glucuronate decarboxylase